MLLKDFMFVQGRHFTFENDHKLLKFILIQTLSNVPAITEMLMLGLQRYSFDIVRVPGQQMHIPDALSRARTPLRAEDWNVSTIQVLCSVSELSTAVLWTSARTFQTDVEKRLRIKHDHYFRLVRGQINCAEMCIWLLELSKWIVCEWWTCVQRNKILNSTEIAEKLNRNTWRSSGHWNAQTIWN